MPDTKQVIVADAMSVFVANTKQVFASDANSDVRRCPQRPIAAL